MPPMRCVQHSAIAARRSRPLRLRPGGVHALGQRRMGTTHGEYRCPHTCSPRPRLQLSRPRPAAALPALPAPQQLAPGPRPPHPLPLCAAPRPVAPSAAGSSSLGGSAPSHQQHHGALHRAGPHAARAMAEAVRRCQRRHLLLEPKHQRHHLPAPGARCAPAGGERPSPSPPPSPPAPAERAWGPVPLVPALHGPLPPGSARGHADQASRTALAHPPPARRPPAATVAVGAAMAAAVAATAAAVATAEAGAVGRTAIRSRSPSSRPSRSASTSRSPPPARNTCGCTT
jgi:hypothetical protein